MWYVEIVMDKWLEIMVTLIIAIATNVGMLIWVVGSVRTDVKNLSGWVSKLDARSENTSQMVAEINGILKAQRLPRSGHDLGD